MRGPKNSPRCRTSMTVVTSRAGEGSMSWRISVGSDLARGMDDTLSEAREDREWLLVARRCSERAPAGGSLLRTHSLLMVLFPSPESAEFFLHELDFLPFHSFIGPRPSPRATSLVGSSACAVGCVAAVHGRHVVSRLPPLGPVRGDRATASARRLLRTTHCGTAAHRRSGRARTLESTTHRRRS